MNKIATIGFVLLLLFLAYRFGVSRKNETPDKEKEKDDFYSENYSTKRKRRFPVISNSTVNVPASTTGSAS